jgi:hypothetical protein
VTAGSVLREPSHRGGLASWFTEAVQARAVYDVIAAITSGSAVSQAASGRAARATFAVWMHVLSLEGVAPWLESRARSSPQIASYLAPAQDYIRAEAQRSLRNAIAMVQQVAEVAALGAQVGVRVLLLKGGARLIGGEAAGARSMADVDLLVRNNGPVLHEAMQTRFGYAPEVQGTPSRHLPSLIRENSLPVEIHTRLSDDGSSLDDRVWLGARSVDVGSAKVEIPSETAILLHTIEHAVVVHRAAKYRLRDVIDVATAWTDNVDAGELRDFVERSSQRAAARTLVVAASRLATSASAKSSYWRVGSAADGPAWRRIRRVARARLLAPARPDIPPVSDPRVLVLSQLAEGSIGPLFRLLGRAAVAPGRAWRLMTGEWLSAEALQAQDSSRAESLSEPRR